MAKQAETRKRTLTITDLGRKEYKSQGIWVRNTTKGKKRGLVLMRVFEGNSGEYSTIIVPETFLPIDLVTKATRKQILQSTDFRGALQKGLLTLMTEEDALEALDRPGVTEELERLQRDDERSKNYSSSIYGESAPIPQAPKLQENQDGSVTLKNSNLNPRVFGAEITLNENGEVALINRLRAVEGELTQSDFSHLLKLAKETSSDSLLEFVETRIEEAAS